MQEQENKINISICSCWWNRSSLMTIYKAESKINGKLCTNKPVSSIMKFLKYTLYNLVFLLNSEGLREVAPHYGHINVSEGNR